MSVWTGNNRLHVSRYEIGIAGLGQAFDGFRVVQLSDLHGKTFGPDQERLVRKVEGLSPDIILCTGDMVDSRRYREEPALTLVGKLTDIAPVYMVSGNHEWRSRAEYEALVGRYEALGAAVLENKETVITRDNARIRLVGITDRFAPYPRYTIGPSSLPTLVMLHRPELFLQYAGADADLIFSGHAHGGQIRLPFVGGLVAPGQGFFPRYDSGVYREGDTGMVVNRGLGNSILPLRVLNPPDVVLATLRAD